ncbi:hypothetical protein KKC06_06855 [Patescibacteria group bacterium]|nr:hypothetical protein [Patescibacteria group bacterium]
MTTFYLDYENGDDVNDGSDWANAWKTITSGATAARIAPGDIVRIAKSLDPTSLGINATWNDLSKTVTLASALTANIDMGEVAWTASTYVTSTADNAVPKEGTYAAKHVFGASFTTGLASYKALGSSTDFSAYQQVSFWVRSTSAVAASTLSLRLCSDVAGVTTVDTIPIPAIPATYQWQVVTVDLAGALGNAIQSVALYADLDPGTPTVYIDNIIACKASSSDDSLTLSSLISKNSAAQGGTEGWYGIQSINGTTVLLDNNTETYASAGRGYSGTTETVATYKRETIKTALLGKWYVSQKVQDSGTLGNNIEFQGGYNTADSEQDGETFFDSQNCGPYGLQIYEEDFVLTNYLNFTRCYVGIYVYNNHNCTISNISICNNDYGMYPRVTTNLLIGTIANINNNLYGPYFDNSYNCTIGTIVNANNNINVGVVLTYSDRNVLNAITNANNNGLYGVGFYRGSDNIIRTLSTTGNTTAGIYNLLGKNYIFNALIAEATEVAVDSTSFGNSRVFSHKHDQTADNHKIFTEGGLISSEVSVRHTASGIAWKLAVTSTNRSSNHPLDLEIAKIACSANNEVTVKAWMRKDHATNITGKLVCRGGQIAGVASDVVATKSNVADTWEELTIQFTPTEAGVVEVEVWAYGGTTNSVYVDDMTISQA